MAAGSTSTARRAPAPRRRSACRRSGSWLESGVGEADRSPDPPLPLGRLPRLGALLGLGRLFRRQLLQDDVAVAGGIRIALGRGEAVPHRGLNEIPGNALALLVERAEVVLGGDIPLIGRQAIPLRRRRGILLDAQAGLIEVAEPRLADRAPPPRQVAAGGDR